jgi:hypothetical protein
MNRDRLLLNMGNWRMMHRREQIPKKGKRVYSTGRSLEEIADEKEGN